MNLETRLTIRRAGAEDADELAAFAARIFAETYGADNRPEDLAAHLRSAYGLPQQRREIADADYITLLAGAAGELAGFAQVRRQQPPSCVTGPSPVELYRFYVDTPWQGRGLAAQLMMAVQRAAAELGGETVWLSVWERNPRAVAFYAKQGFLDAGGAVFHVGTDPQNDRIMVKAVKTD